MHRSSDEAGKGFYRRVARTIVEATLQRSSVEVSDDGSIAAPMQDEMRRCVRRLMRFRTTVRSLRLGNFRGDIAYVVC